MKLLETGKMNFREDAEVPFLLLEFEIELTNLGDISLSTSRFNGRCIGLQLINCKSVIKIKILNILLIFSKFF